MRATLGVLVGLLWAGVAHAQSGSNEFASWVTERFGGKAVTTITPAPGRPGLPTTHIRPDAIGGITRSVAGNAASATWSKTLPLPIQSIYSGATQTLGATAARTATKAAIIDTAIAATKVSSPVGWAILGAGILGAYFDYDPGSQRLKTWLVPDQEGGVDTQPVGTVWRANQVTWQGVVKPATDYFSSKAAACEARVTAVKEQNGVCYAGTQYQINTSSVSGNTCYGNGFKTPAVCNGSYTQATSPSFTLSSVTGCPTGWTQNGSVCEQEQGTSCPEGYSYVGDFVYGGFECKPNAPAAGGPNPAPLFLPPDEMVHAAMSQEIGSDGAKLEQLLNDLPGDGPGVEAPLNTPLTGPASLGSPYTTTTNLADGGRIETSVSHPVTYINNTVVVGDTITNTTYNSNDEIINQTVSDGAGGPAQFPDDYAQRSKQCGYPGGPACKLDETGTPTEGQFAASDAALADAFAEAAAVPGDLLGAAPETAWGLSFGFPTSCVNPSDIVTAAGVRIVPDLCQHEGTIHAAMTFVWLFATAVACAGMIRQASG